MLSEQLYRHFHSAGTPNSVSRAEDAVERDAGGIGREIEGLPASTDSWASGWPWRPTPPSAATQGTTSKPGRPPSLATQPSPFATPALETPGAGAVSMSPAAMFLSSFSPVPSPSTSKITQSPTGDTSCNTSTSPTQNEGGSNGIDQGPAEGSVIANYKLGKIVGYGAFSTIRLATSASGDVAAVKIVTRPDIAKRKKTQRTRRRNGDDESDERGKLAKEKEIWSSLSHEHILPLYAFHSTPTVDLFFTTYCPAGSLFDILKAHQQQSVTTPVSSSPISSALKGANALGGLPQDDAGMILRQLTRGLQYLHNTMQLVHCDIKMENILVDEWGVVRIGDFGMCRAIGEKLGCKGDDDSESDVSSSGSEDESSGPNHLNQPLHRSHTVSLHPSLMRAGGLRKTLKPRHRTASTSVASPSRLPKANATGCEPGSLPYAAPELLSTSHHCSSMPEDAIDYRHTAHPSRDIWALGVLLHTLMSGKLPFFDRFEPRMIVKILHGTYTPPSALGRHATDVLNGCLDRNPLTRWTINMVDERGWSVGWGMEVEAAAVHEDHRDETPQRGRVPEKLQIEEEPKEELPEGDRDITSPADDASNRRSVSRARRSLSRAPVPVGERPRPRRSLSRNTSDEIVPRSPGFVRGRKPTKHDAFILSQSKSPEYSSSRSRSPPAPSTPLDGPTYRSVTFASLPEEMESDLGFVAEAVKRDPSRGRKEHKADLTLGLPNHLSECSSSSASSSSVSSGSGSRDRYPSRRRRSRNRELDVLSEDVSWNMSPTPSSLSASPSMTQEQPRKPRPESLPPSPRMKNSSNLSAMITSPSGTSSPMPRAPVSTPNVPYHHHHHRHHPPHSAAPGLSGRPPVSMAVPAPAVVVPLRVGVIANGYRYGRSRSMENFT